MLGVTAVKTSWPLVVVCRRFCASTSQKDLHSKALKALGTKQADPKPATSSTTNQEINKTNQETNKTNQEINKNVPQKTREELVKFQGSPPNGYAPSGIGESKKLPSEFISNLDEHKIDVIDTNRLTDKKNNVVDAPTETSTTRRGVRAQLHEFVPRIVVAGIGGGGCNALNHMISKGLQGVDFLAMNTDAQHLSTTLTDQRLQLGVELTGGLGCGADPEMGRLAAEECRMDIEAELQGANMIFLAAGMGGGTGTGATPIVAEIAYHLGILTVAVVTLPFLSEGIYRHDSAAEGVQRLRDVVDTLIVVPNQNLLSLATQETSIIEAYSMADDVMLGGVQSISNLITKPGLVNTDFADFQAVMYGMGNALLGTGVVPVGQGRGLEAANMALDNPLLGSDLDISSAKGLIINVSGGSDLNLLESDAIISHIKNRLKESNAKIISGWTYDESLRGFIRVSVVATGIDHLENDH